MSQNIKFRGAIRSVDGQVSRQDGTGIELSTKPGRGGSAIVRTALEVQTRESKVLPEGSER